MFFIEFLQNKNIEKLVFLHLYETYLNNYFYNIRKSFSSRKITTIFAVRIVFSTLPLRRS